MKRKLGKTGIELNPIGLGCMGMSEFYGGCEEEKSVQLIHDAIDRGMNFFDTADMYGTGHNEQVVGRALKSPDKRAAAVLCTKFGVVRDGKEFRGVNGRPDYVRQACDGSLKRLGVEYIDLYYQHRVDPEVPIEETVGAMAELVAAGKVKYLGLSEAAPETIRRADQVHPITALQTEYSLWTRDPEESLLDLCRELGITFVAYSPLGRGFLTGAIRNPEDLDADDWRRHNPRFQGENFDKNLTMVEHIRQLAEAKGCTPAQLALAWVLSAGEQVVSIPGTRKLHRLEENLGALSVELTPDELKEIDRIIPPGATAGTRYPEMAMKMLNG